MKSVLVTIFMLALLSGCGSQYVGRPVNMNSDEVCKISNFPANCSASYDDFLIKYTIDTTGKKDEYRITGKAKYYGGPGWSAFSGASFKLLIISNKTVVDDIGIAGGSGSLSSGLSFSRSFVTPNEIQGTIVGFYMQVQE